MNIIKRNGSEAVFDKEKIYNAIIKAMKYGSGLVDDKIARLISNEITIELLDEANRTKKDTTTIEIVENVVYYKLTKYDQVETAKAYEGYRAIQSFKRENNTTDDSILGLLDFSNNDVMNENSNKNAMLLSTQRDLVAGEVSKDIARRKKIPTRIIQAHDCGVLHYHDQDYAMQDMFNCCLINIKDMLDNGTVINKRKIDSPRTFQVACTVMTQIIAQVASNQYGGQSVNIAHLGKYLRRSKEKYIKMLKGHPDSERIVNTLLINELSAGVQTIQYQINTLMTTNG